MGTSVAILVTLVNLPSLSSQTSFSSPSLLSFPVAFNAPSSPVVVIPPDDQAQVNEDLTRSPCPSPGYHRDPKSCSHFYICTDLWAVGAQFQVHRLECAPGTVWDEVQLTCNWPYQVPECSSQVEAHLEEAKVEVAEKVEEKEEDIEVEESTNAMEESTDIDKEEQEEVDEDEEGKAGQGDLFFSGTWSSHKCTGPGISPHPEQCSKFWLCRQIGEGAGLQALLFECPPSYQFNSTILRCSEAGESCRAEISQWRADEIGVFVLKEGEMEKFFDAWSSPAKSLEDFGSPTQSVESLYNLRFEQSDSSGRQAATEEDFESPTQSVEFLYDIR